MTEFETTPDISFAEVVELLKTCVYYDPRRNEPVRIDRPKAIHVLLDKLHIKTAVKTTRDKSILIYHKGVYQLDGDMHLERILAGAFTDLTASDKKSLYSTSEKNQILDRIRESTMVPDKSFDANINVINLGNGLYNWNTCEFKPHTSNYLSRIQSPVKYDPKAECPTILKFLEIILKPEDIQKIIEFIAYCLYRGYPIQKIFILLGPGGTGKSFLVNILNGFVGDENVFSVSPQDLAKDRFAGADLFRKLLNAMPDVGDEKLAQTAMIKTLTGHTDKTRAQRKYGDPFDFVNFAKMIFGLNSLPETSDKTSGWYRRLEIIRMEHILGETELSKEFLDKLTSPEELSGLFNIAMKELPKLLKRNAFTGETSREDMADIYEYTANPLQYFVTHFVKNVPRERIAKDDLFEHYKRFCEIVGLPDAKKDEGSLKNNMGRFIHKNVDWLSKDIRKPKDEVAYKNKKAVAIWPDTKFDDERFNEWAKDENR